VRTDVTLSRRALLAGAVVTGVGAGLGMEQDGAGASSGRLLALEPAGPVQPPPVVSRAGWGAAEKYAWWKPVYTPTVKAVVVHHTVSSNGYSSASASAQVREIFSYHARTLDWGDIGYNFLIDRFGTVYEGRKGGAGDPVVGGHCYGFNHETIGIALIGTFDGVAPPAATRASLARLTTWVLARYHRDPRSTELLVVDDKKNPRHPHRGSTFRAPVIGGHRDLYPTDCCGGAAYATLPALRSGVDRIMGPRFVDPVVSVTDTDLLVEAGTRGVHSVVGSLTDAGGAVLWSRSPVVAASLHLPIGLAVLPTGSYRFTVTPRNARGLPGAPLGGTVTVTQPAVVPGNAEVSCVLDSDTTKVSGSWAVTA
jgi:hypothetical protein